MFLNLIKRVFGRVVEEKSIPKVRIVTKIEGKMFQSWPEKGVDGIVSSDLRFYSWKPLALFKDTDQVSVGDRITIEEDKALKVT